VGGNAGSANVRSEFSVGDLELRDNGLGGTVDCDILTRDCAFELKVNGGVGKRGTGVTRANG
jgi:hypothetical protein